MLNFPHSLVYFFFSSRKINPGSAERRGVPPWALMEPGDVVFLHITVHCLLGSFLTRVKYCPDLEVFFTTGIVPQGLTTVSQSQP